MGLGSPTFAGMGFPGSRPSARTAFPARSGLHAYAVLLCAVICAGVGSRIMLR